MGLCQCNKNFPGIELEFGENVRPGDHEMKVYNEVCQVILRRDEISQSIDEYKGCQELARAAMSKPSDQTEMAAFEGLLAAVDAIQGFYEFATSLEKVFPKLMKELAKAVKPDHVCNLNEMPALAKQLATIFDFTLQFDRVRMLRPNLSNDFSYYRRLLPKFNKHPGIKVKDDEASGMALFTAEHIPMTTCLAKAGSKAQELLIITDGKGAEGKIGDVLATMANSCQMMLKAWRQAGSGLSSEHLFIARAMTGSVVIFDHVDHQGAFHRRSRLNIKPIINTLKKDFSTELSLLNAIRYSTKNFRDAPEGIQAMFD